MGLPDGAAASSGWTYLRGVRRPAEPCGWRAWWPSRAVWRPAPGPRPAHRPVRPVAPGRVERRTHDYVRHGTTTLFAALEVATGHVTDACHPRHRHGEFLGFLKLVARAYPRRQLHVVLDNCGHPQARQGPDLADQPSPNPPALHTDLWVLAEPGRGVLRHHRAPGAAPRGLRQRPGADGMAAILRFCDSWNQRCHPFTWTKNADQILTKLKRQTTAARTPGHLKAQVRS
jgi:hypothetical protein